MNIDKKLELAHEYAMKHLENSKVNITIESLKSFSWQYADAMEAEAEKRIKATAEKNAEESKVFFEKLNSTDSIQLEWQPDWSVAPDGFDWWAMDEDMMACWYCVEPYIDDSIIKQWDYDNHKCHKKASLFIHHGDWKAPSFNYKGDWKDSLRKRPK